MTTARLIYICSSIGSQLRRWSSANLRVHADGMRSDASHLAMCAIRICAQLRFDAIAEVDTWFSVRLCP
jgi:hypothetical protein